MMVQTYQRKTREVTGPAPYSVGIFAKPPRSKPVDWFIIEQRKRREGLAENQVLAKELARSDLKNEWQRNTDAKIQINNAKRQAKDGMKVYAIALEERREKLRDLLHTEEQQYLKDIVGKEETLIERQAKMREKAKILKEQREAYRQEFVEEKLRQQWRNQCEELRGVVSKRECNLVASERMKQLRDKEILAKRKEEEERMYADLWYADIRAKADREEEEARKRMESNRGLLEVLQHQMAAVEAEKQKENDLKYEEAKILEEQARLRKLEEAAALEEKHRKQNETRQMFDKSVRMKREREARNMQEQLAFDMKILEQLLEETHNEAMEAQQRKRELREEDKRYRDYLERLQLEEGLRERELERICDAEVEKMWEKKVKQWKLEKEARRKLLVDVMAGRRRQLEEKLAENERRQREALEEREKMLVRIEQNKRIEAEEQARARAKGRQYGADIVGQIQYNQRTQLADQHEQELLWQSQMDAEAEYRKKLEIELAKTKIPKLHPIRKHHDDIMNQFNSSRRGGTIN